MKCLLTLFLIVVTNCVISIRITRFVVPTVASFGSLLHLDCAYDLENDQLYDVKWYKDSDEFFRCKSDGQVQTFDVDGIHLDKNQHITFRSCPVLIVIVDSKSSGQYRCEVSSEGPEFKTAARQTVLRISNTTPSRRTQTKDNLTHITASTEASTQPNGNWNAMSSASFLFIILMYQVKYLIIKVMLF